MTDRRVVLFLPEVIRIAVEPNRTGAYVLGDIEGNAFKVNYVGRSDLCLRTRLLTHNHLYTSLYFYFQYTASCQEAFLLESKWWHLFVDFGDPLQNKIHPGTPVNKAMACPYCQFAKDMRRILH